jgi:hypothetical protein
MGINLREIGGCSGAVCRNSIDKVTEGSNIAFLSGRYSKMGSFR